MGEPTELQARFDRVLAVMFSLAQGQLDARVELPPLRHADPLHETLDGICVALDMLAEELQATVIRKERYESALEKLQQTQDQLLHSAKLAALGELAAGVAHELNQPLQIIGLASEEIRDAIEEGDLDTAREFLDAVEGQVTRGAGVVGRLLAFSRRSEGARPQVFEIDAVVREVAEMLAGQLANDGVDLELRLDAAARAMVGQPDELHQVFTNLVINARDAVRDRPERRIVIQTAEDDGSVCVEVSDTGTGIPADVLPRVFDPFFTTKPTGRGTGLGLSVSHGIVQRHGGTIEAHSEPGHGTRMRVTLPAPPLPESP